VWQAGMALSLTRVLPCWPRPPERGAWGWCRQTVGTNERVYGDLRLFEVH
jgi:hypothetical protein